MDEETVRICGLWDNLSTRLFHAYQDAALAEIG